MPDREKVIKGLEVFNKNRICLPHLIPWDEITDAIAMLKEQEDEKKRIMKVIWDTLHEGLSIDTVADQDWVYEQIRHRIEDT